MSTKPFPPRIMAVLREVAERKPKGMQGPWEDGDGEPLQDDAEEAIAWINAQAREIEALRAVPAGWKLVPLVPTKEMIDAGYMHTMRADEQEPYRARGEAIAAYSDMLASAPLFEAGG